MLKFRITSLLFWVTLLLFAGCPEPSTPTLPSVDDSEMGVAPDLLTMLIIDDSGFADSIERQWQAEFNGQLNLIRLSKTEFIQRDFQVADDIDLVLYPHGMIGELESRRQLIEIPNAVWQSEGFNKNELLPLHRSRLVRHNNKVFGVSLGGPQLMWLFDRQWLDQQTPSLPATWDLALPWLQDRFVAKKTVIEDGSSETSGTDLLALPLAEEWAVHVFLSHVAPTIRSRGRLASVFDRSTMQPLIEEVPFRIALDDLKKMMGDNLECLELAPADVYQRVLTGKAKMGIGWPNDRFVKLQWSGTEATAEELENEMQMPDLVDVGLLILPGSKQWFDIPSQRWNQRSVGESMNYDLVGVQGSLLSVTTKSRNIDGALQLAAWLGSKSGSLKTVAGHPEFGPFRQTHLGDPMRWTGSLISERGGDEFAEIIRQINQQDVQLLFPRIPGRHLFLAALDEQIRACLRGEVTSEQALSNAASRWQAIIAEKGVELMIRELRKDSGI